MSSHTEYAKKKQARPEDFMDEEDHAECVVEQWRVTLRKVEMELDETDETVCCFMNLSSKTPSLTTE
jgi:hypothetical protein